MMKSQDLLRRYPIVTDQIGHEELSVILGELEQLFIRGIPGDIVELGCHEGASSLFITRLLCAYPGDREYHVYDSFLGLPEKGVQDTSPLGTGFTAGQLAVSRQSFIRRFRQNGLPLPRIHRGWFSDIRQDEMPDSIAFAFLDGDFYQSIIDSFRLIGPRLVAGAVVIVDDYQNEALPGVRRAVDGWLSNNKGCAYQVTHSLCVIRCD